MTAQQKLWCCELTVDQQNTTLSTKQKQSAEAADSQGVLQFLLPADVDMKCRLNMSFILDNDK